MLGSLTLLTTGFNSLFDILLFGRDLNVCVLLTVFGWSACFSLLFSRSWLQKYWVFLLLPYLFLFRSRGRMGVSCNFAFRTLFTHFHAGKTVSLKSSLLLLSLALVQ